LAKSRSWARSATLVLIVVVPPTQRPAMIPDRASGAAVDQRLAEWPPDLVSGLGLPAGEVGGRAVRARLQQHDAAAALGKLSGDHPAAGAGADHRDIEVLPLVHAPTPR